MIRIIPCGDLFSVQGSIGHGVNCAGAMGKGIALEFRSRFPDMYKCYHELCLSGNLVPGGVYAYQDGQRWIYNLGTQRTWRERAKAEYLRDALEGLTYHAKMVGVREVTFPKICAGLGGMDWDVVKSIFQEVIPGDLIINLIENSPQKP